MAYRKDILHQGNVDNLSRRRFIICSSFLATSAAILSLSPIGRALADLSNESGEFPEKIILQYLDISLGFNGERRDPITGFYHLGNGYRVYNPSLMCFYSQDSFSPIGAGGVNAYSYCRSDPINFIDPTGHISTEAILGITFGIYGIVLSAALLLVFPFAGIGFLVTATAIAFGIGAVATGTVSHFIEESHPEAAKKLALISVGLGLLSIETALIGSHAVKCVGTGVALASSFAIRPLSSSSLIVRIGYQLAIRPISLSTVYYSFASGFLWTASTYFGGRSAEALNQAAGYTGWIAAGTVGFGFGRFILKKALRMFIPIGSRASSIGSHAMRSRASSIRNHSVHSNTGSINSANSFNPQAISHESGIPSPMMGHTYL